MIKIYTLPILVIKLAKGNVMEEYLSKSSLNKAKMRIKYKGIAAAITPTANKVGLANFITNLLREC